MDFYPNFYPGSVESYGMPRKFVWSSFWDCFFFVGWDFPGKSYRCLSRAAPASPRRILARIPQVLARIRKANPARIAHDNSEQSQRLLPKIASLKVGKFYYFIWMEKSAPFRVIKNIRTFDLNSQSRWCLKFLASLNLLSRSFFKYNL